MDSSTYEDQAAWTRDEFGLTELPTLPDERGRELYWACIDATDSYADAVACSLARGGHELSQFDETTLHRYLVAASRGVIEVLPCSDLDGYLLRVVTDSVSRGHGFTATYFSLPDDRTEVLREAVETADYPFRAVCFDPAAFGDEVSRYIAGLALETDE